MGRPRTVLLLPWPQDCLLLTLLHPPPGGTLMYAVGQGKRGYLTQYFTTPQLWDTLPPTRCVCRSSSPSNAKIPIRPNFPVFHDRFFSYLPALPSFDPVDGEDARQVDRLPLPRGGGGVPVVPATAAGAAAAATGVGRGGGGEDEEETERQQRRRLPRRRHGDREHGGSRRRSHRLRVT